MDWQSQFEQWQKAMAANKLTEANCLLEDARKAIPKTKGEDKWHWFEAALQKLETSGFVACVFAKHPIPKSLMQPFLSAGVQFGNASTIKAFVIPCLESFGHDIVDEWFSSHGTDSFSIQEKAEMARYWYPAARHNRRKT